jgi:hypothetical protein
MPGELTVRIDNAGDALSHPRIADHSAPRTVGGGRAGARACLTCVLATSLCAVAVGVDVAVDANAQITRANLAWALPRRMAGYRAGIGLAFQRASIAAVVHVWPGVEGKPSIIASIEGRILGAIASVVGVEGGSRNCLVTREEAVREKSESPETPGIVTANSTGFVTSEAGRGSRTRGTAGGREVDQRSSSEPVVHHMDIPPRALADGAQDAGTWPRRCRENRPAGAAERTRERRA